MLLVPVDRDVGHKDAAYAGAQPTSQETEEGRGDLGGIRDPAMESGVQPSASLLEGKDEEEEEEEEGAEDEGEVTDGEVECDPTPSPGADTFGISGTKGDRAEWEHIPLPGALQAEMETASQSAATSRDGGRPGTDGCWATAACGADMAVAVGTADPGEACALHYKPKYAASVRPLVGCLFLPWFCSHTKRYPLSLCCTSLSS